MRNDYKIALLLFVAALPAGVTVSSASDYFPFLKEHPAISFYGSAGITLVLLGLAAALAIRGEYELEQKGSQKRMLPLLIMIVGLSIFAVGAAWYFAPTSSPLPAASGEAAEAAIPKNIKGSLAWSKDISLGFGVDSNDNQFAHNAQIYAINVSEKEVKIRDAYAVSDISGQSIPMLAWTNYGMFPISEINPVPPGAKVRFILYFNGDQGIYPVALLNGWARLSVVISYNDTEYRASFDIEDRTKEAIRPMTHNIEPHVTPSKKNE